VCHSATAGQRSIRGRSCIGALSAGGEQRYNLSRNRTYCGQNVTAYRQVQEYVQQDLEMVPVQLDRQTRAILEIPPHLTCGAMVADWSRTIVASIHEPQEVFDGGRFHATTGFYLPASNANGFDAILMRLRIPSKNGPKKKRDSPRAERLGNTVSPGRCV